jgi:hypothetical protein
MFQLKIAGKGSRPAGHLVLVQETQPEAHADAGTVTAPEHEKSGGMPQLEFGDFPPC